MVFHADLHIHSKYSRACSKDCDLEHLAWWAARKGISVVGTGDFTHPAWREELRDLLVPAEPGLFRLRPDIEARIARTLPPICRKLPRFMLSVEISTIYKRAERTRKVHHLLYAPTMAAAEAITADLAKIGNLASDGRPILGLDSRDLLEITLASDPGSYLVPAHVWTPWFSALGSKSGFDAIADCYADLAGHVFAVETGLSSDPAMNWMVSSLDSYTLVSNSDAHSPPMLAREATRFDTDLDYYAIRRALETGEGFRGSVEFFPEEGKYHLDGHRKCDVRFEPETTREHGGRCPVCGRPLTVGVFHRVHELADRAEGYRVPGAADFTNLVPLPEIVGEILRVGPKSKRVQGEVARVVAALGSELDILATTPLDEVTRIGGERLGEAISRLRRGAVIREAGYDGEYGTIRMFEPGELSSGRGLTLFDHPESAPAPRTRGSARPAPGTPPGTGRRRSAGDADGASAGEGTAAPGLFDPVPEPGPAGGADGRAPAEPAEGGTADPTLFPSAPDGGDLRRPQGLLDGLDPDQRAAAERPGGPLLIVAGPGTGKTRTVTHRIAHLVAERGVPPEDCLAITFTRRAAEELSERLSALLGERAGRMTVTTFHGLGARILREQHGRVGLTEHFRIADEARRAEIALEVAGSDSEARRLLARRDAGAAAAEDTALRDFEKRLRDHDLVDFGDLLALPVRLLGADPDLARGYRERWPWISVDEYQDVDETQYTLLRLLTAADGNITAIGDPDQAIYGFRGADVGFFLRFTEDFPAAETVRLTRNYRSNATIVSAAVQAIAPSSLVPGRALRAVGDFTDPPRIGVHAAADERAEASFVARAIDRLLGGTSWHSLDSGRASGEAHDGLSFGDICVLYRTDAQSAAVVSAFNTAGVPFQKRSHDRLLNRPGVRLVADELAHHPEGPVAERVRAAVALLAERHAGDPELVTDLRGAGELVLPLAARCGADLPEFLSALALGAEVDALDPRADRVALLTLHAAKGLEYPVVFLLGCEDGLLPFRFPGARRDDFPGARRDDEDEERRLFFVGVTRAQHRLYLSRARRRTRRGTEEEMRPSPFLAAIDAGLTMPVDEESAARRRPRDRQLRLL
ncbi:UvrD-helicase domain-containing protein [Marinitenerispora sediminis]|uniref:DNA 3'-5' helicase n=1 Tax=Marinitenerispora sediminis TaxID=1931232 RepID=A0A368T8U6_9ACTN|nr:UvrD-helicase domain-containing protein [Marinitenerispora sediminis]RCV55146.1 AAA family ATPase [Marinitenerispora sediminis]RCV58939.1 AAA family ATPase [Marinitenerispora sediminis]RCV61503.1 AAA family ATPase [Marinitenerispora sediminis]